MHKNKKEKKGAIEELMEQEGIRRNLAKCNEIAFDALGRQIKFWEKQRKLAEDKSVKRIRIEYQPPGYIVFIPERENKLEQKEEDNGEKIQRNPKV